MARSYKKLKIHKGEKVMNPMSAMKMMKAKDAFVSNHPKFAAFIQHVFSSKIEEGTIIEITVTKPGEAPVTTNMKVQQSDLDLFNELKSTVK